MQENDPFAIDNNELPKAPPVSLDGTVEISIPGSVWNSQYGAVRIVVPTKQVDKVAAWVADNHDHFQATFDEARKYQGTHAPAAPVQAQAAPAQVPAGPVGAQAILGIANGAAAPAPDVAADGMVTVQGKFGPVSFPSPQALTPEQFRALAVQVASAELGIDASLLVAFDNRAELIGGTAYSSSPGVIKFARTAPPQLVQSVLTQSGKPGNLAWVSWDAGAATLKVKPTKEFLANSFSVAKLLMGGAA